MPNGITYPGIALDVESHPGRYRIEIAWLNGSDPNVVKARIYWNNYTEGQDLDIPPGADTPDDIAFGRQGIECVFSVTDFAPNLFVPVRYIRFKTLETFNSILSNPDPDFGDRVAIGNISFYGLVVED